MITNATREALADSRLALQKAMAQSGHMPIGPIEKGTLMRAIAGALVSVIVAVENLDRDPASKSEGRPLL